MNPSLRKFTLTTHVVSSVGWLGAVAAYLCLAVAGLTSDDAQLGRAAYLSMELVGWIVIVPFSLAALLAGLVEALGTRWGLFRHWWILVKFLLTAGAALILLQHMQAVSRMAGIAAETTFATTDVRALRIQLVVHAAGGLLVLLAAAALSVYKPWGMTPYGRRKSHERPAEFVAGGPTIPVSDDDSRVSPGRESAVRTPRWAYVVGIHAVGLALLLVILHLTGGGLRGH